jgi:hypothetical protein
MDEWGYEPSGYDYEKGRVIWDQSLDGKIYQQAADSVMCIINYFANALDPETYMKPDRRYQQGTWEWQQRTMA